MNQNSFQLYLDQLPDERKEPVQKLRKTFQDNLPDGFKEHMGANSLEFVIPHSIYPDGYHCNPKLPLPFISIVSQKNVLTIHHLGFYASQELTEWFVKEYTKSNTAKLDMGKGCLKFKKMDLIPFDLFAKLSKKISVSDWIKMYKTNFKKK